MSDQKTFKNLSVDRNLANMLKRYALDNGLRVQDAATEALSLYLATKGYISKARKIPPTQDPLPEINIDEEI